MLRMVDLDESEDSGDENPEHPMPPPKPAACAKVLIKTYTNETEQFLRTS